MLRGPRALFFGENMRSRTHAIGFGLLLTASSAPALAQSPPGPAYPAACAGASVPPAKSDEAHAFYSAGRAQYDEGNYDAAIAQFREAYKRDCSKHDLLVIMSRASELKGDRAEAVRALQTFLERVKDSPDAATHRTKIDNLKKQIAAQPPQPPPEVREHTIPPWIVVGAGGVAIVTGAILLVAAPAVPSNCNASDGNCNSTASTADRDRAGLAVGVSLGGYITLIGGGALVAGGLLWHFLEPVGPVASTSSVRPRLTPQAAPGYAGISFGTAF